jgi:hypothetical protein
VLAFYLTFYLTFGEIEARLAFGFASISPSLLMRSKQEIERVR